VLDAAGDDEAQIALLRQDLERLVRRLRGLSPLAWRTRRGPVQAALRDLEWTTASIESRPPATMPEIADHALGDALAVIGNDALVALSSSRDDEQVAVVARSLRFGLDQTR
jgi:hypothetical protein